MKIRVYISYSRSDLPVVAVLASDLQALGQDVWLDRDLPGGATWWHRQLTNLARTDVFIVAISRDAMDSTICRAEVALAESIGIPILPVLVDDGVSDSFLPRSLGEVQREDYRRADREAMAKIVLALQSALDRCRDIDGPLAAAIPKGYEVDVRDQLRSSGYLSPPEQLDLIHQLGQLVASGLHVPRVVQLLQRFRERDDTTAKAAQRIDEMLASTPTDGVVSDIHQLTVTDLPERRADDALRRVHGSVFLSYSRSDRDLITSLTADVERVGWSLWLDRKLPGGQPWWDEILARIRASDVFVFAVSGTSVSSRACTTELDYAASLGKPMIAVVVGTDNMSGLIPQALSRSPTIQYERPSKHAFTDMLRALTAAPAPPPLPSPLPPNPPVPATYMFDIRSRIQTPEFLTPDEQEQLLGQLAAFSEEGYPVDEVAQLANELLERDDLTRRMSDEIATFAASAAAAAAARGDATERGGAGHDTRGSDLPPPESATPRPDTTGTSAEPDSAVPDEAPDVVRPEGGTAAPVEAPRAPRRRGRRLLVVVALLAVLGGGVAAVVANLDLADSGDKTTDDSDRPDITPSFVDTRPSVDTRPAVDDTVAERFLSDTRPNPAGRSFFGWELGGVSYDALVELNGSVGTADVSFFDQFGTAFVIRQDLMLFQDPSNGAWYFQGSSPRDPLTGAAAALYFPDQFVVEDDGQVWSIVQVCSVDGCAPVSR